VGILLGTAFLVGVLTALTPCVLPVLPIVLAVGPGGSRLRPYAIIAGLVISFTLFTMFWTAVLDALPIPADLLRDIAIAIIALTAISLLVPKVAELAAKPFEPLARIAPKSEWNGLVLGLALGLVFTPCAGLLIGSIASAAATQEYSWRLAAVVLAYAIGAGLSLLAIMLAARKGLAMRRVQGAAPRIRQALGVLMLAAVVVMAVGADARLAARVPPFLDGPLGIQESDRVADELAKLQPAPESDVARAGAPGNDDVAAEEAAAAETGGAGDGAALAALERELPDYGVPPELENIQGWINGEPTTLAALRGKVVVIDFWTYSCVNCIRTLPHIRRWYDAYEADGLIVIGVHTPEFAFEAEPDNVEDAVGDLNVTWPVALDSRYGTWTAWGNRYWPAKYVIDREGHVRFAHFGEGAYSETERVIRALLAEGRSAPAKAAGDDRDEPAFHTPQTAETYLGHERAQGYAHEIQADRRARYDLPGDPGPDKIGLGGEWTVAREQAVAGRGARLRLHFRGRAAHLVLSPDGEGAGTATVRVDGRPTTTIRVRDNRLYTLAEVSDDRPHLLELGVSPGVSAYAFTFGPLEDPADRVQGSGG
jgi:cytochrome c biogenesis protein CcdA/thiol-disulfide isomerase/thioredoxin